ncbi:thioester domain-containing protein, partial [Eubacteriales bacterium OttesenSCG-928-N13]|nr:thioester domain-containing protein [Eubacteriales bacterium OttesenSCG-928-N13]
MNDTTYGNGLGRTDPCPCAKNARAQAAFANALALDPVDDVTQPFIINTSNDITGEGSGNVQDDGSPANYCHIPGAIAGDSNYRRNMAPNDGIFQFYFTPDGGTQQYAYCLEKTKVGPTTPIPYETGPIDSLMAQLSERQRLMISWIIANSFPAISAQQTFINTDVDPSGLNDYDAYAVVSTALYLVTGEVSNSAVNFLECSGDVLHPKSPRLRTSTLNLVQLAGEYADQVMNAQSSASAAATSAMRAQMNCCSGASAILCCNETSVPSDSAEPYIAFIGCPDEVRMVCGRPLIGPFVITSSFAGTPTLTFDAACMCGDVFSVSYADFCGNAISGPTLGQEFYLSIRVKRTHFCFTIGASISGTVNRVNYAGETVVIPGVDYQTLGFVTTNVPFAITVSMCVCVDLSSVAVETRVEGSSSIH